MARQIPLLVFAKEPEPGKVKTRLLTDCSEQQAADIAVLLLKATLGKVVRYWPGSVAVCAWPKGNNPQITQLAAQCSIAVCHQVEGDLGAKMSAAIQSHGFPTCIVGADAPQLSKATLVDAHDQLRSGNNVIGPSPDGGYYMIGLSQPQPEVFKNIEWSAENVLTTTLERAPFSVLDCTSDVDTWADLLAAQLHVPGLQRYLSEQGLA